MSNTGFIKLHRSILDNPLYGAEPFTKTMAWIDLLLNAKYRDEVESFKGLELSVKRGQLVISLGELSRRWKWTRSKVQRFLDYLEREGAIQKAIHSPIHLTTLVSIVNYDKYQATDTISDTHIKEDKEYNNPPSLSKERVSPLKGGTPISERQRLFYDSLIPFVIQYGKAMIRDFYDYWSETDRAVDSKKKMRWEKEKTWSLERRLERWKRMGDERMAKKTQKQVKPSKLDQYKEVARQLGIYHDGAEQDGNIDEQ